MARKIVNMRLQFSAVYDKFAVGMGEFYAVAHTVKTEIHLLHFSFRLRYSLPKKCFKLQKKVLRIYI